MFARVLDVLSQSSAYKSDNCLMVVVLVFVVVVVVVVVMLMVFYDCHGQVSHEKNPGWLGYIGDYTTQLY